VLAGYSLELEVWLAFRVRVAVNVRSGERWWFFFGGGDKYSGDKCPTVEPFPAPGVR